MENLHKRMTIGDRPGDIVIDSPPKPAGGSSASSVPSDIQETITRLAALHPIEAERECKEEAKRLGCTVATLRKEVNKARGDNEETGNGQAFAIEDPKPWPDPVDGAQLLNNLAAVFRRHVVLPDHGDVIAALWAAHSYAYDLGHITPILVIQSPEKGCGKTTLRDVLAALVRCPLSTDGISASALFRVVEKWRPTLLLDDFDSWGRENEELRGVLNTGYRRGGVFIRCSGDDNEPRTFATFSPKAINLIGKLHPTLYDRAVVITMRRKLRGEPVQSMHGLDGEDLQRQCARWVRDNSRSIEHHKPEMPSVLFNRQADNWRPLLALADVAGGEWPVLARKAAAAAISRDDDNESAGVMLLADVRQIMDERCIDVLFSADLTEALHEIDARPWSDWRHGKPITAVQVARLLKPYGIRPGDKRDAGNVKKGYRREQFAESWERYLSATPLQNTSHKASSDFQPATRPKSVADRNATENEGVTGQNGLKPAPHKDCSGVADQNPENARSGWSTRV